MTTERLAVVRLGEGRLRVRAGSPGAASSLDAVVSWLSARRDVLGVTRDASGAQLEVRYHEPGVRGAFVRALEDQLHAMQRVAPLPFALALGRSSSPGRARLELTGGAPDDTERLAAFLAARPGVARARPSPASESVTVFFDPEVTSGVALLAAARDAGRANWPAPPALPADPRAKEWRATALNTAVLAACAVEALPPVALAAGVALTAVPPLRRAARALREKRASVDMLDVAAISISLATGQPGTAAFITWLLGVGDWLLAHSADRARAAISRLMSLDTAEAFRVVDEGRRTERVPAEALVPGDEIVVEAGQRVAADGVVIGGAAAVDEKALTGESEPRDLGPGERVLAASVVLQGRLHVRVERTGVDTTAAKIVKILEGAGAKPMTLQRDAERVADKLVLPTFGLAGAAGSLGGAIESATSVLITDFGTGIRIAVPTSALAAMTLAARRGVLVKGAQYLERLARADTVVFDKTGTLTSGLPELVSVVRAPGAAFTELELVALCAGAEARQSHPIAEAFKRYASAHGVATTDADMGSERYAIGLGLEATVGGRCVQVGGARWLRSLGISLAPLEAQADQLRARGVSTLWVAIDGALAGLVGYADALREESRAVVAALRAGGKRRVILLSGDSAGPVAAVARTVGVDEAVGELLPEDKAAYVRALQRDGRTVAMVGDGINDAPALALADVGISLHGGTDVALETADVVLLEGGLGRLPVAFDAGERALAQVRRSLGMVIGPNAVAIVLGALGLLNPGLAALVNNGTTVVAAGAALLPLLTTRRPSLGPAERAAGIDARAAGGDNHEP